MPGRGRFITLEGGEGAGKSTQLRLLVAALAAAEIPTVATREPGGSPEAETLRSLLLEGGAERWDPVGEALLLAAARRHHLVNTIEPTLASGSWVVSDRFADSTLAYQGYGKGLPLPALLSLQQFTLGDTRPDLTLILDLPVELGLARAAARPGQGDRFERLGRDFHERLRAGFRAIAEAEPKRCVVIDASGAPEVVHAAVLKAVQERLSIRLEPAAG